jgi:hypothetical protein
MAFEPKGNGYKTRPLVVYTVVNLNNAGSEKEYIIKNETENNP